MYWLQNRWALLCLAVLGSAVLGFAYYWNRKRTIVHSLAKKFDSHLDQLETRSELAASQLKQSEARIQAVNQRLASMRAAAEEQEEDTTSGSGVLVGDDDESDDDVLSGERSVSD